MPAQPNRSLADGIALLGALCTHDRGLGSREAARLLGWEPTRANRMLGTLRDMGLAEQAADRSYRPGPGVHLLATHCLRGSGLLAAALPILRGLRGSGLGFALGVLWRGQVSYLLHAAAGRPIEEGLRGHGVFAADNSSIGLILEAHTPGIAHRNPPAALAAARAAGYGVHRNPGDTGRGSVAVAIPAADPSAPPMAGVSVMADLVVHPPEQLAALLRPAAAQIAAAIHAG